MSRPRGGADGLQDHTCDRGLLAREKKLFHTLPYEVIVLLQGLSLACTFTRR